MLKYMKWKIMSIGVQTWPPSQIRKQTSCWRTDWPAFCLCFACIHFCWVVCSTQDTFYIKGFISNIAGLHELMEMYGSGAQTLNLRCTLRNQVSAVQTPILITFKVLLSSHVKLKSRKTNIKAQQGKYGGGDSPPVQDTWHSKNCLTGQHTSKNVPFAYSLLIFHDKIMFHIAVVKQAHRTQCRLLR